ncbi:PREDICTED: protein BPS1, chloroplastic [Theobroma cacao]|uniref:Protein BPS1, chloroplastic n=1 Tax=Theobroma cacao TaxID=3641 RepID=A0AB32VPJ5_THECC|nr:PREDICTED: protein BPS1, chloroplastic [Theobroma cacao]
MVLLVDTLSKLYSKLENHHHHRQQSEADVLSASLQAFRSDVSNCLNQLLLNSKPGSEILSFSWIQQCFELLPLINRAFAKLVVDIDYPMSSWEVASVDEYLNYGLHLLELLNSVSSSLSHLAHARLSFAHALTLVENSPSLAIKHLKAIQPQSSSKDYKWQENKEDGDEKFSSCKEKVVNLALMEIKAISFWVSGVVLATLSGEAKPYLEIKQLIARFNSALLNGVDSIISEVIVEKGEVLREVKDVNNAAASLASAMASGESSSDAARELERRLGVFEKQLEALEKEVDNLFSKFLAGRNELLHGVCQRKQ